MFWMENFDKKIIELRSQFLFDLDRKVAMLPVSVVPGLKRTDKAEMPPKKSINFTGGFHHV